MPTPVSAARQCLTTEASNALDEAVAVAKRRGHAQTTSLHALSAFLALPSSVLREACARVRSSAYSPRLQFKALELSFGVALDRLPSTTQTSAASPDEPPISNSLMAAIKRSQANQRRNPESFHLYQQQLQQQQQQQSSVSCVKVELQQLILSILDDPVVSRVFAEAGFRSCDVKLSIVRPPPPLVRYQRSRCPPLFLCNLPGGDSDPGRKSFSFPFSGFSGVSTVSDGDENCRRIGEVLARKKERNPLLVGVCANDAVKCFAEIVETGRGDVLPVELSGLDFSSIEEEVTEFISGNGSEGSMGLRFEELERSIETCSGPGVVINIGELKCFIDDSSGEAGSFMVSQLKRLLDLHSGKFWLMGTATTYETYLKFLTRFPSIEKDLDLQLLPITSSKPSIGGFCSRPQSLMESFVPFGGFFSMPPDLKGPSSNKNQSISRCNLCNDKCEQEISAILKGGNTVSVADQYQDSLPSWLQASELSPNKVKDDGTVLNAKVTGVQMKWNDICRRLNHSAQVVQPEIYHVGSQVLPRIVGFPSVADREEKTDNGSRSGSKSGNSSAHASPSKSSCENVFPSVSMGLQNCSATSLEMPTRLAKDDPFVSKLQLKPSESESLQIKGLGSATGPPQSMSGTVNYYESPATSVTTDLGLGTLYASSPKVHSLQAHQERVQDISGCSPAKVDCSPSKVDVVCRNISNPPLQSSASGPHLNGQFDPRDIKLLWKSLAEKVGRQNEAIYAISETISQCRSGLGRRRGAVFRRDIWLRFVGPDRVAKRRIATALAEIMFESRENLICVDLSSEDGSTRSTTFFDCQEINGYDTKFRGKTVIDYIVGEISKKPLSIVFLENIDKADLLVQNSLTQAIKTGRLSDLRGREIGINNAIFITTSGAVEDSKTISSGNEHVKFSEERILGAQVRQMQILIGRTLEGTTIYNTSKISVTSRAFVSKRKLTGSSDSSEQLGISEMDKRACKKSNISLDLNLPVEANEEDNDQDSVDNEQNSLSSNSESWLEDFLDQVDRTVVFKPFDFDALAEKILKEINDSFRNTFESDSLLEIDIRVMEQILAAAWLADKITSVEDWILQVLRRSFVEVRQTYGLSCGSILKLVTCEGLPMEEKAPGVCLPAKVILH